MTPLAPLYLLGVLAVAGPILFHLWRRTPRGRREFSTLMFLAPSPPRVTSRSRVEHWLLLLLRGTVLGLLALAFARPLWRTSISEPEKGSDVELVAILVDTSASLRRDAMWTDLVRQVKGMLSLMPETTNVGLFQFDDQWKAIADFAEVKSLESSARRELILARLGEIKPSWRGTNLGDALVRTAAALQEAQTERSLPAKLRILVASDLQSGAKLEALHGYEWPADVRIEPIIIRASSPSNAGLQLVERNLELGDDLLRVRITNSADARKESFALKWDDADSPTISIYVPPGQSRVVVPPKRPEQGSSSPLILSGDDHEFDNKVYVAPIRAETKLVVYLGNDKPNDPDGLRFYLEGVFTASRRYQIEMTGWRESLAGTKTDRPSLVVLVEPDTNADAFVTNHLSQGGAILVIARSADEGSACLRQCGLNDVQLTEATVRRDAMLGDIDFEHPLFAPFAESQFSDFTGIRFWKHRQFGAITRSGNETPEQLPHAGRVLARFDDGSPAFVEFPLAKGRVWLFTAGWHPADSQLARSSKFPPLVFRMLEQASGAISRPESVAVGSSIPWLRTSDGGTSKGTVARPDGSLLRDLPLSTPFVETTEPGLYRLEVAGQSEMAAVNLSPDESRTAPMSVDQLESLGVKLGAVERPEDIRRARDRERQLQLAELEQTQKLWRWGLLAVIGLLLIETWVAGRRQAA